MTTFDVINVVTMSKLSRYYVTADQILSRLANLPTFKDLVMSLMMSEASEVKRALFDVIR